MANHTPQILRSRIGFGQPDTVPLAQTQLQTAAATKKERVRLLQCEGRWSGRCPLQYHPAMALYAADTLRGDGSGMRMHTVLFFVIRK